MEHIHTDYAPPASTGANALTADDLAMFEKLGIPPDLLADAHICRVTDAQARRDYGMLCDAAKDLSGVLFAYFSPVSGLRTTARVRRDKPEIDADGKSHNKYISAYGDGRHLYFAPGAAAKLENPDMPVVLVEAEKSALALTAWAERTKMDLIPIAMGGCYGWHTQRRGKTEAPNGERIDVAGPLADLDYCDGHKVYVLLDANVSTNPKVAAAQRDLIAELRKRKCDVLICDLPSVDSVNGPDDFLAICGDTAMAAVFDAAHKPTRKPAVVLTPKPAAPAAPPLSAEDAAALTSELLATVLGWIRRYVVVSNEQAIIMAAWMLHSYVFELFESTPYLHIKSPEKESGKSTLVRILRAVARKGKLSQGISAAALARWVAKENPTLFLDELDTTFRADKEKAEAIRGILNSGFDADGTYTRCVGKDFEVTEFPTFCPKVLAGIGELWDTVASRSIPIALQRKLPQESIQPDRNREVSAAAAPIKAQLEEWAARITDLLAPVRPAEIAGFSPRQNDNAEPLLAIATLAGDDWLQRVAGAIVGIYKGAAVGDASTGVMLLGDIRQVFDTRNAGQIPSKDLIAALCDMEDGHPWAEWNHGRGFTTNNLARNLKGFTIFPRNIRVGSAVVKGYSKDDFEDAWARYIAYPPISTATPLQGASLLAETAISNRYTAATVAVAGRYTESDCSGSETLQNALVAVQKSGSTPHEQRIVAAVAVHRGGMAIPEQTAAPADTAQAVTKPENPNAEFDFDEVENGDTGEQPPPAAEPAGEVDTTFVVEEWV